MMRFCTIKRIKPNFHSVEYRLPFVYKKYLKSLNAPPAPVHYIPHLKQYILDPETNQKKRVENRLIPLKFPKEADEGIWGGEGVIQGFVKEKKKRRRYPNFWVPRLKKAVVYSEILNQYLEVTLTERTLRLIDENSGFDYYIFKNSSARLKIPIGLKYKEKNVLNSGK